MPNRRSDARRNRAPDTCFHIPSITGPETETPAYARKRRSEPIGMSAAPALLAAAAGVGLGHAVLPDHWVPLAVVGRTQRYPLTKVARLSLLAGVAHVLVSLMLGAIIIAVGLQFRSTIESAQSTIIGVVLILTAVGFGTL